MSYGGWCSCTFFGTSENVSHLIDADSFMACAVRLQHEVRRPLGRGDELSLGMLFDSW